MRRKTLDLDRDLAHGQSAWWRARSTSIDGGLEEIRRVHVLGGKSLPAGSYGILPNLKKHPCSAIPRRIEKMCHLYILIKN